MGLAVGRSWLAGAARETPTGSPLPGVYRESYAYGDLQQHSSDALSDQLDQALGFIEGQAQILDAFLDRAGRAELFIGWHFERNSGDVLDWTLLRRIADLRLSLILDIYPPAVE
jgi:hypothetical protein